MLLPFSVAYAANSNGHQIVQMKKNSVCKFGLPDTVVTAGFLVVTAARVVAVNTSIDHMLRSIIATVTIVCSVRADLNTSYLAYSSNGIIIRL
jgi:hypothetical protein